MKVGMLCSPDNIFQSYNQQYLISQLTISCIYKAPMHVPNADGFDSEENDDESIYQYDYDGMHHPLDLYFFFLY